jgi:hypothetical protein
MKTIAAAFFFITFSALTFGQTRNMDISQVGPKTQQVNKTKYAEIYYVSQKTGSDKNGDGSETRPWATLFQAMNSIKDESAGHYAAVFVAEGDYSKATVKMKEYIDLYGGFNSRTWKRDIYKNPTALDGRNARRVVLGADNAVIDGFIIMNGLSRSHGGGILCDDSAPTISNCIIKNNYVLEPVDFNNQRIHQHGNDGGGVACLYDATPTIINNLFYNNRTSIGDGGALSFYGWSRKRHGTDRKIKDNFMVGYVRPVVKNNVFVENTAGVNDIYRTRSSNGGAISCSHEARPILENNIIASNRAKGNSDAGGIYVEYFSYPTVKDNWITGNISDDDGGGIYIMRLSDAQVMDNFIAGNWTMGGGVGGVRLSKEGRAQITGNVIVENQSGGGVQCVDSYMELKNNIIMNNLGKYSIFFSDVFSYFKPSVIDSNIVHGNRGKLTLETKTPEQILLRKNNFDEKIDGNRNFDKTIKINEKYLNREIKSMNFDTSSCQTIILFSGDLDLNSLVGHVIKIGEFWSVIEKAETGKLYVWGNAALRSNKAVEFQISPAYQLIK